MVLYENADEGTFYKLTLIFTKLESVPFTAKTFS